MAHLTHITDSVKKNEIVVNWRLVDAKDKILGRLATEVASHLTGKNKVNYSAHLDMGDHIVIINARGIKVTGTKEQNKLYSRYSGYPGGLKKIPYHKVQETRPEEIIRRAISGMLPKNKLRARSMARLYIFEGDRHPYEEKFQ